MKLANLRPARGANRKSKKVGRGNGSGHGRTSCRGSNGANSRSGAVHRARFEGGQMPLQRRLPKRGFHNHFRTDFFAVNLGQISERLSGAATVDAQFLSAQGLIPSAATPFKILGDGDIGAAVTFKADHVSAPAKAKIEKAGGKIEITVKTEK